MAERKKPETSAIFDSSSTPLARKNKSKIVPNKVHQRDLSGTSGVTINRPALKGLALRGTPEPFVALCEAVIGDFLPKDKKGNFDCSDVPKFAPEKGVDNYPNLGDIKRWLESLGKKDKRVLSFATTAWATAKSRT